MIYAPNDTNDHHIELRLNDDVLMSGRVSADIGIAMARAVSHELHYSGWRECPFVFSDKTITFRFQNDGGEEMQCSYSDYVAFVALDRGFRRSIQSLVNKISMAKKDEDPKKYNKCWQRLQLIAQRMQAAGAEGEWWMSI